MKNLDLGVLKLSGLKINTFGPTKRRSTIKIESYIFDGNPINGDYSPSFSLNSPATATGLGFQNSKLASTLKRDALNF